jgi:hypothetical protein
MVSNLAMLSKKQVLHGLELVIQPGKTHLGG